MKHPTLLVLIIGSLTMGQGARAQLQSITTYGSGFGLGGTTTIQPMGNGYTYSTIGGPSGGSWVESSHLPVLPSKRPSAPKEQSFRSFLQLPRL
jgi:hypothetical protein